MGHDCAEDARNVACRKGHAQLLALVALRLQAGQSGGGEGERMRQALGRQQALGRTRAGAAFSPFRQAAAERSNRSVLGSAAEQKLAVLPQPQLLNGVGSAAATASSHWKPTTGRQVMFIAVPEPINSGSVDHHPSRCPHLGLGHHILVQRLHDVLKGTCKRQTHGRVGQPEYDHKIATARAAECGCRRTATKCTRQLDTAGATLQHAI